MGEIEEINTFVYDADGKGKMVTASEAAALIEAGEYSDSPAVKPKAKKTKGKGGDK